MKEFDIQLGAVLKRYRKKAGYTQKEIAEKIGVSKMAVSNWESGNRSMYASALRDYCKALNISMSDILGEL